MCCHKIVRSSLWSLVQTSDKGHVLKEYANINYKGIWACSLIIWKKSWKFYNSILLPVVNHRHWFQNWGFDDWHFYPDYYHQVCRDSGRNTALGRQLASWCCFSIFLKQRSANYSLWAKTSPPSVFMHPKLRVLIFLNSWKKGKSNILWHMKSTWNPNANVYIVFNFIHNLCKFVFSLVT